MNQKIPILIEATGKTPNVRLSVQRGEEQPTNEEYEILKETFGFDLRGMEHPEFFLRGPDSMENTLERLAAIEQVLHHVIEEES